MTTATGGISRRQLLRLTAASGAALALPYALASGTEKSRRRKTLLSFYCDDTSPYVAGAKAFQTFLDYCAEHGIAGEASCILGGKGHSMARDPNEQEQAFLKQVERAWNCGLGTHMELMTHHGLFDFEANREPESVIHEGLWLYEPAITVEQYTRYFGGILAEGERAGIRFSGLTWPGCSCSACERRYAELRANGQIKPNPAVWSALLELAKQKKFRSQTVPCFFDSSETEYGSNRKASDGSWAVYDLVPNAGDHFGIWENNPNRVQPNYYLTADGKSGVIVRHLERGSPYCIWYAHWQGLNPATGVGWQAFTTVVERIREHLGGRVVWMRPSDITDHYHRAGGWDFLDSL